MNRTVSLLTVMVGLFSTSLSQAGVLTFQHGMDGYFGVADTGIRFPAPDTNYGGAFEVSIDSDDGPGSLNPTQGLLRFADIIGAGPGKIPVGAIITSATLTFNITSGGSGIHFHRMLIDWSESTATWNTFSSGVLGGVQANDIQALAAPTLSIGANDGNSNIPAGILTVDLTADVQAWANGAANFGWAMLPFMDLGTNGIDFLSREGAANSSDLTLSPRLMVTFRVIPEPSTLTSVAIASLIGCAGLFLRRRTRKTA